MLAWQLVFVSGGCSGDSLTCSWSLLTASVPCRWRTKACVFWLVVNWVRVYILLSGWHFLPLVLSPLSNLTGHIIQSQRWQIVFFSCCISLVWSSAFLFYFEWPSRMNLLYWTGPTLTIYDNSPFQGPYPLSYQLSSSF